MKKGNSGMAVKILYKMLLLCAEAHLTLNKQNDNCASVRNVNGVYLSGFAYQSFISESLDNCFATCRNSERCQSINFVYAEHRCDLNVETIRSKPDAILRGAGITYAENLFRVKKGSNPLKPGRSCLDILVRGDSSGNGEFWIDPEGQGNSFKVFCDMTTDGGGWTLIKKTELVDTQAIAREITTAAHYSDISQYNNSLIFTASFLQKLREEMHFDQIRFFCFKKSVRRVFHIMTNRDKLGEAVVQYFTNSTVLPQACGSFTAFPNDNSTLSKHCHEWGKAGYKDTWGNPRRLGGKRLFNTPIIVSDSLELKIKFRPEYKSGGLYCDEDSSTYLPLTLGDEWKVYVR